MQYSIGYLPNRYGVTDTLIIWNHFATVMNFSFLLRIGENAHTQRSPAPSQLTPQPTRPKLTWWSFSFYQKTSKVPHQTLFTAKTSEWQKGQIWQSSGCCGADSQIYKCQVQLETAKKLSSKSPSPLAGSCTNFRASSTSDIHSFSREMRRRWYFCISSRKGLFLSFSLALLDGGSAAARRGERVPEDEDDRVAPEEHLRDVPVLVHRLRLLLAWKKEIKLTWAWVDILFHRITHTNHYPSTIRMHAIVEVEGHL